MTNYITYNCLQNASCIRKYFQVLWFWGVCWKLYIFKINHSKINEEGKQDGRGVGGHGVHLSPQVHQEHTFRHRSACRTPAESGQKYVTSGKEYVEPCKLGRMKELEGKAGVLVPCTWVGELKQGSDPHIRAIVWVRGEMFKAEWNSWSVAA